MKNIFLGGVLFISIVLLNDSSANAQIVDGAFQRTDMIERKPMELPYVREADVMWSKRVWRILDLREKMNQKLYYPTMEMEGINNLINTLLKGIKEEKITAYDASSDDEFKVPMTFEQVKASFGAVSSKQTTRDIDTGETIEVNVEGQIRSQEIKQIMIKEEWFFDRQTSTMNVRIIGICPIREYYRPEDINQENVQKSQVFWVYFPEVRDVLAVSAVKTDVGSLSMSYDDLFIKRRFSSYIVQVSNTYNNRRIDQYLTGIDIMTESQRVEDEIFVYEQDLWEY
ncbi:MAG: gliding motility protein GldN [Mangrovibacterium sp.]